jgi:hypothetical protein
MRITVRLDPDLLREVKLAAAEDRTTVSALLEQPLREMLALRRQSTPRLRTPLPTFTGWGLQPGVDLDNDAALRDLLDQEEAPFPQA